MADANGWRSDDGKSVFLFFFERSMQVVNKLNESDN